MSSYTFKRFSLNHASPHLDTPIDPRSLKRDPDEDAPGASRRRDSVSRSIFSEPSIDVAWDLASNSTNRATPSPLRTGRMPREHRYGESFLDYDNLETDKSKTELERSAKQISSNWGEGWRDVVTAKGQPGLRLPEPMKLHLIVHIKNLATSCTDIQIAARLIARCYQDRRRRVVDGHKPHSWYPSIDVLKEDLTQALAIHEEHKAGRERVVPDPSPQSDVKEENEDIRHLGTATQAQKRQKVQRGVDASPAEQLYQRHGGDLDVILRELAQVQEVEHAKFCATLASAELNLVRTKEELQLEEAKLKTIMILPTISEALDYANDRAVACAESLSRRIQAELRMDQLQQILTLAPSLAKPLDDALQKVAAVHEQLMLFSRDLGRLIDNREADEDHIRGKIDHTRARVGQRESAVRKAKMDLDQSVQSGKVLNTSSVAMPGGTRVQDPRFELGIYGDNHLAHDLPIAPEADMVGS